MSSNLRKFVCPRFTRSIDPLLIARLFERHRHALAAFDLDALRGEASAARSAMEALLAGPEERCPEGLVADLHRIAELGTEQGLRLLLAQAARLGIAIAPEAGVDECDRRRDARHVALRTFLEHPRVFDAASDMLVLAARAALAEFAGSEAGVEADFGEGARAAFTTAAAKMFEADHCGGYCRTGWYNDADSVNLVLTHGSVVRTATILRADEERVISYRAAQTAVLSYSAATGRIKIGGGTPLRRSALAELFADKMLGRSGFFAGPDAQDLYTLAPIERAGCGFVLNHAYDPAIRRALIVEARAHRMSVDRFTGGQCLAASVVARDDTGAALTRLAEAMGGASFEAHWRLGQIVIRTTIESEVGKPVQTSITIKPPARAIFRRHQFEGRILDLLHRNGLLRSRIPDRTALAA